MGNRTRSRPHQLLTKAALPAGVVGLLALVPACSSSSIRQVVATTSTTTAAAVPVTVPNQEPAEIVACASNAKVVETALAAYDAVKGAYPSPPSPWSAASYAANYQALTASGDGGPFMSTVPPTTSYVIAYDAAGHVWVTPPGIYGPYNQGQDIEVNPDTCDAAVG